MNTKLISIVPLLFLVGCVTTYQRTTIERFAPTRSSERTTEKTFERTLKNIGNSKNFFAQQIVGLETKGEIVQAIGPPLREHESKITKRKFGGTAHEYTSTAYWEHQLDKENSESIEIFFEENGHVIEYKVSKKRSKFTKLL